MRSVKPGLVAAGVGMAVNVVLAIVKIATGILGAVGARWLFDLLHVQDPAIRGFAMGVASHGIGTARAFQVSEQEGAFAALAMGLNGALTALLLHARRNLPWRKALLLDYPAGESSAAIQAAGFQTNRTLLWMKLQEENPVNHF